jgi:hypothetical protein
VGRRATVGSAHLQGAICNAQTVRRTLKIITFLLQGHLHRQIGGILADFLQPDPEVHGVTDGALKALIGPTRPA